MFGLIFSAIITLLLAFIAGGSVGGFAVGSYFIWILAPIWVALLSYPMIAVLAWLAFLALYASACAVGRRLL